MFDKIEKLRKKGYGERKRVTFFLSAVLTLVVAFVWGTTILPRTLILNETESEEQMAEVVTPFKTLTQDAGIIWGDIQTGVHDLKEEVEELWVKNTKETLDEPEEPTSLSSPRGGEELLRNEEEGLLEVPEEPITTEGDALDETEPLETENVSDTPEVETEIEVEEER